MRQTLILLISVLTLIACNNSDTTRSTTNNQTEQQADTIKSTRNILIQELKKLQQAVASNDKEKIAGIFQFPLSETAFSIYIDDSTYNELFKTNDSKTTKTMFLQFFKEISSSIQLDQINNLFKHIKVDSLLHNDILQYDAYINTEPCYYSYKIEVIKDNVTLRMDMASNQNYKSKKTSPEDIPENSSEFCEHNFWWIFRFDGHKLSLTNISGAD